MIDPNKILSNLQKEEIRDETINLIKKLKISEWNELLAAAKKNGGLSSFFTMVTGRDKPLIEDFKPIPKSVKSKHTPDSIYQQWCDNYVPINPSSNDLYGKNPSFGIVIGTFAALPYVHMQLESRKRLFPNIPMLVHDDHSNKRKELQELCKTYDCDFEYNTKRQPHHHGDITSFVGGLMWADSKKLDILLKISRRWVWLVNWVPDLLGLAIESQCATFSNFTRTYGFGFRTEAVGLSVKRWAVPEFYGECFDRMKDREHIFVESFIHEFAKKIMNCSKAKIWMDKFPMDNDKLGYAQWDLIGTDRANQVDDRFIWHDSHGPEVYAKHAKRWGLDYVRDDFVDPNQGQGIGEKP